MKESASEMVWAFDLGKGSIGSPRGVAPMDEFLRVAGIRHEKVILDFDLAALYGVETRALNQAVKRNLDRFPADFMFQITDGERAALRSQSGILNVPPSDDSSQTVTASPGASPMRSQIVTASKRNIR